MLRAEVAMRMFFMRLRKMARGGGLAVPALLLALSLGAAGQVHVERSQDGKLLVTDQSRGGTQVYADAGSAPAWRHKDGWLEVWEPAGKIWVRATSDYPQVSASGTLVFGYGPGGSGSAVYDVSRKAWVPQFDRYPLGAVSETLAVGFGGPGRVGIYDSASGAWQTPNITGEQVALSGSLVAFYGSASSTSIYDAPRQRWRTDISSFGLCTLGEELAVFYGPPGTNVLAYDIRAGEFVVLKEPVDSVQVYGEVAIALGPRHKVYIYTGSDRAWTEFRGQSDRTEIVGGDALVTDLSGDTWIYKRGSKTFEKTRG